MELYAYHSPLYIYIVFQKPPRIEVGDAILVATPWFTLDFMENLSKTEKIPRRTNHQLWDYIS